MDDAWFWLSALVALLAAALTVGVFWLAFRAKREGQEDSFYDDEEEPYDSEPEDYVD